MYDHDFVILNIRGLIWTDRGSESDQMKIVTV